MSGFFWALLSALLALVAGGLLLWNRLTGLMTLTYVLIAFFVIDGILAIALDRRPELSDRWEWMLSAASWTACSPASSSLPARIAWVLGLVVGISLVFRRHCIDRHGRPAMLPNPGHCATGVMPIARVESLGKLGHGPGRPPRSGP